MWNRVSKSLIFASLMVIVPLVSAASNIEDTSSTAEVAKRRVPVKIEGKKMLP